MAISAAIGLGTASVVNSVSNGQRQAKAAKQAAAENKLAIEAQTKQQEMEFNKANAKKPNVTALMDANAKAAKNGGSGTMLTGPQGTASTGTLGKSTLLGGP